MDTKEVVDVTEQFPNCIKAERCEENVLVLWPAESCQRGRYVGVPPGEDGYELSYKWLRNKTADITQIMGSEVQWLDTNEVDLEESLFEQFRLFP